MKKDFQGSRKPTKHVGKNESRKPDACINVFGGRKVIIGWVQKIPAIYIKYLQVNDC